MFDELDELNGYENEDFYGESNNSAVREEETIYSDEEFEYRDNEDNEPINDKRKVILKMAVGALVIICLGIMIGKINFARNENKKLNTENVSSVETTQLVNNDNTKSVNNVVMLNDGWIQFDNSDLSNKKEVQSEFTVWEIKHYAKVLEGGDKQIKSVLRGNVRGLPGTYEVAIAYSKAIHVRRGTIIKIKYLEYEKDEKKVVDGIECL